MLSGGLGVVVRLDRSSSVCIYMDHELQGHAQGLCGVYSGRPEGMWGMPWLLVQEKGETGDPDTALLPRPSADDFQEPGGRLAVLVSTFGNSWTLPDSEVRLCPQGTVLNSTHSPLLHHGWPFLWGKIWGAGDAVLRVPWEHTVKCCPRPWLPM